MTSIEPKYLIYLGDTPIADLAKTGAGLVYWRPERCLAQLREPGCAADLGLPDMDISSAAAQGARTLVIGVSLIGGALPPHWIGRLIEAMEAGLDIASGLHEPLGAIPALAEAAARTGRALVDVRLAGGPHEVANGLPRSGRRLLTVGTDCAVGKKYTALALHRALQAQGRPAHFRATGQTGVLIDGSGVAIDAVVSDFIAGAAEALAPAADADHWDIIEGQGSILHPAYAGVSVGLLMGAQPDRFVVCHAEGRTHMSGFPEHEVASISEIIELTITLGRRTAPQIACAGIALNTSGLNDADARAALARVSDAHGLPSFDPVRFGLEEFIAAAF